MRPYHLALTLALAAAHAAAAQTKPDFHWDRALGAGSSVSVHNISGNITVKPSTNGKIDVNGYKHGDSRDFDRVDVAVVPTSRGVVICVIYEDATCDENGMHSRGWDWGSRRHSRDNAEIDLEITVPASVNLHASSVSGDMSIAGVKGDLRANTVSGRVLLDGVEASSLSANSVSGSIEAHIDALTSDGDLTFHTVSGRVTLELPRNLDADVSLSSVSGGLETEYPMTLNSRFSRRHVDARIGRGGRQLRISTVSGSVKLKQGSR